MSEQLEQTAPGIIRGALPALPENFRRNAYTAAALGGVAALATASDYLGMSYGLPHSAELIETSAKHPIVGYLGAWAAASAFRNSLTGVRTKAAIAGATIANFATEAAQSTLVASPEYVNFLSAQNLPETGKDYVFTLAGLGLFLLNNRRKNT
jgi:hypothetical protein